MTIKHSEKGSEAAPSILPAAAEDSSLASESTSWILPNGIELPADWPPKRDSLTLDPIPVPYLKSPPEVISIAEGRQLFVDDFLIEESTLTRTWHKPVWHPATPVLVPDKPWERMVEGSGPSAAYSLPSSDGVWYDPEDRLFKMWYLAGLKFKTALALSDDGIHWRKPELEVVPGTNIVLDRPRDSSTVWLDHNAADPMERFKMFRFEKKPRRGFYVHYSPDGIHWSGPAAKTGPCFDRSTVFYDPFRQRWVFSVKGWSPLEGEERRYRRFWDTADLKGPYWKEAGEATVWIGADRLDPVDPELNVQPELYNLDAVAYESVLLGLFNIWQGQPDPETSGRPKRNQVFVGFSRDGFHWDRSLREPFIGVSEDPGAWNWGNIQSAGGGCLVVGDELHFYVSCRGVDHEEKAERGYAGMAVLRRDGFASMDTEGTGVLTTRQVTFSGGHMFLNTKTRSELRVEILSEDGRPIEPFTSGNCLPVRGDSTSVRVRWKGEPDLAELAGRPVRFRFHLSEGSLYAFWVTPDSNGASGGYIAAGGPGFTGTRDTFPGK